MCFSIFESGVLKTLDRMAVPNNGLLAPCSCAGSIILLFTVGDWCYLATFLNAMTRVFQARERIMFGRLGLLL